MSRRLHQGLSLGTLGLVVSALALSLTGGALPAASAVTQSGVTELTAQVVQPGGAPTASSAAKVAGSVRFTPARQRRPVVIQRRVGAGPWSEVTTERQNSNGQVGFTGAARATDGSPYTYRGVAKAWRGLSEIAATPQSTDIWQPVFTDEFAFFDEAKWRDRPSESSSRKCAKVGDPSASDVEGGTLRLRVMKDPERTDETCTVRLPVGSGHETRKFSYYVNGQVGTQGLHAFTRGMFAARIKFPEKRGQHGSFWMQPVRRDCSTGPAGSGAELDIVEFFGKGYPDGGLASFLYSYGIRCGAEKIGGMAPNATRMLPSGDAWWKNYHVFSLEWTSNAYIFRVDGREHYRTTRGVTAVDEYLILSLLSSDWELKQAQELGIQPAPSTMYVDWARVWQK